MSEELKPCPFCGVQPTLFENGKLACCESITCSGNQFPMLIWQWQSRPIEDELRSGGSVLHEERARIEKLKVGKSALRNERNFLRRKHLEALAESAELRAENEQAKKRIAELIQEKGRELNVEKLANENDALRAENEQLRKVNNSTYCAYCNASYERTDDALAQVRDHIKVCEHHPMRKLEAEVERLTAECDTLRVKQGHLEEQNRHWAYELEKAKVSCNILGDAKEKFRAERDRYKAALIECNEFLKNAPFNFKNGNEYNGVDEGEVFGLNALRELIKMNDNSLKGDKSC